MRSLQDVVYNYMTIKVLLDENNDDEAAKETCAFFSDILKEKYETTFIEYTIENEVYIVKVKKADEEKIFTFPEDAVNYMKQFEVNKSGNLCK